MIHNIECISKQLGLTWLKAHDLVKAVTVGGDGELSMAWKIWWRQKTSAQREVR